MSFVHLHVHSQYSLLDGLSDLKKLVARTKELGMPAVALTDHGTMFGVIEFFNAAKAAEVKPIIGLEAYMAPRRMTDRDAKLDKRSHHLLLLAANQTGYQNLLKIASASQLEGFYYHPRIDHEFLAEHSEGLICTSGCMSAEVPRALRDKGVEEARRLLDWYYELFGPERFFIELQSHEIPELLELNRTLLEVGKHYNARYVATNDVHYIKREDARLQDILLAIQTGALISDPNRFKMSVDSFYLRSPEEMSRLFSEVPEAISNTLLVADSCNVDLSSKGYHLPHFPVPEGDTADTYLRKLCEEGLYRRYGSRAEVAEVRERLEYELRVIHEMGFDAYFLIVWDLCRYARENGIWYNVRGSGAGSMVAYTLDITRIEPIGHGLIFERFLNPGRISMPDIDLDFQDDMRPMVMEYCANRYGADRVAQIITFGTLGARAAIRDVGRVMDIPLNEVDRVSKLIPNVPGKAVSIREAIEQIPELKAAYNETDYLKELIDTAAQMEGVVRNAGTHAAGVVISDEPIVSYVPLHRPTNTSEDNPIKAVTQFEMSIIESLGLLKVDFLGLSTLTVMQRASRLIKERHNVDLELETIPIDDAETFEFLSKGHTAGVFQLEGTGMTRFLVQMKPQNLDNVIAMVALYRPGPLEFIPTYIKRMHGEEPVEYRHPSLEPIFKETFGIPVYQEQIMRAAVDLGGYTLSESDELRKAISKKQKDKIEKHKHKFIHGAVGKGMEEAIAEGIFSDWEEFARYGFNKSHAADYGVVAVQTAYLKTHYTAEYMTALLSAAKNDSAKVAFYVADCRSMGIPVLPPDINTSGWDFTIEDCGDSACGIRFGMGAIKNVGQAPVDLIMKSRADGPFTSLTDFSQRVDLRAAGKRSLECLAKVGALDSLGERKALLEAMDQIISVSASHFKAAQSGQLSFFGAVGGVEDEIRLPFGGSVDTREKLEWERELLGLYVSDHPLSPYLEVLKRRVTHFSGTLGEARERETVTVAGMVTRFRNHQTKTGKTMGFVTLEDIQGNIDLVLFPGTWEKFHDLVIPDAVLVVEGKADTSNGDPKILVDKLSEASLEDGGVEAMVFSSYGGDVDYGFGGFPDEDNIPVVYVPPPAASRRIADQLPSKPPSAQPGTAAPETPVPVPAALAVTPSATAAVPPVVTANPPIPSRDTIPARDTGLEPPEEPPDWHLLDDGMGASDVDTAPARGKTKPAATAANTAAQKAPAVPAAAAVPVTASAPLKTEPAPDAGAGPRAAAQSERASAPASQPAAAHIEEAARVISVPPLVMPSPFLAFSSDTPMIPESSEPRMVKVLLRSTGNREQDARRIKMVYGKLHSCPGHDHFSFLIFEGSRSYLLDFPNDTTGISSHLIQKLIDMVGEENVRVEPIHIQ